LHGANSVAEYIHDTLENLQVIYKGETINFTASIGGASLSHTDVDNSLFTRADEALLHSKKSGRNCVSFPGNYTM